MNFHLSFIFCYFKCKRQLCIYTVYMDYRLVYVKFVCVCVCVHFCACHAHSFNFAASKTKGEKGNEERNPTTHLIDIRVASPRRVAAVRSAPHTEVGAAFQDNDFHPFQINLSFLYI